MFLTSGELAFAVPGGVILGAAISLVGQRVSASMTLRGQRALAEDHRIWERRCDAYLNLLATLREFPDKAHLNSDTPVRTYNTYRQQLGDVTPPILAFASAEIQDEVGKLHDTLSQATSDLTIADSSLREAAMVSRLTEIRRHMNKIAGRARDELQGAEVDSGLVFTFESE